MVPHVHIWGFPCGTIRCHLFIFVDFLVGMMKTFDAALLSGTSEEFLSELRDTLVSDGVFQLTNAEVLFDSTAYLDDAVIAMKALFGLSVEEKQRYERRPGLTAMGFSDRELTKQTRDEKELWDICWVPFPDRPLDHSSNRSTLDGFNLGFPSSETQASLLRWHSVVVNRVCFRLFRAFCDAFDMNFEAVQASTLGEDPKLGFMRLNYYHRPAVSTLNIHEHTDAGLFTVLWASEVRGTFLCLLSTLVLSCP